MSETPLSGVLPCPFCGAIGPDITVTEDYRQSYGIQCDACGAGLYHYRRAVDAIEDWNRRPPLLTARQQAILEAADAVRDAYTATARLDRYSVTPAAAAAYHRVARAERVLKDAACQSDETTTNGRPGEEGDDER